MLHSASMSSNIAVMLHGHNDINDHQQFNSLFKHMLHSILECPYCLYLIYAYVNKKHEWKLNGPTAKKRGKLFTTGPLWGESTSGSPHKGPVMWKEFPYHDVTMCDVKIQGECYFFSIYCHIIYHNTFHCKIYIIDKLKSPAIHKDL